MASSENVKKLLGRLEGGSLAHEIVALWVDSEGPEAIQAELLKLVDARVKEHADRLSEDANPLA